MAQLVDDASNGNAWSENAQGCPLPELCQGRKFLPCFQDVVQLRICWHSALSRSDLALDCTGHQGMSDEIEQHSILVQLLARQVI